MLQKKGEQTPSQLFQNFTTRAKQPNEGEISLDNNSRMLLLFEILKKENSHAIGG
jgi:hypothetical protein